MNIRRTLPARRQHEIVEFDLDGLTFIAGVGRFVDGELSEIFFHSAGKPGSHAERLAQDLAVAASLALQHGASASGLRHSLVKLRNGRAAGPLGMILELVGGDADVGPA